MKEDIVYASKSNQVATESVNIQSEALGLQIADESLLEGGISYSPNSPANTKDVST